MCSTVIIAGVLVGLQSSASDASAHETTPAIRAADIGGHIEALSSDAFGGREPGTEGELMTVDYIEKQFDRIGLTPAGEGGSWLQPVPMIQLTPEGSPEASFELPGGERTKLLSGRDVKLFSPVLGGTIEVESSPIVFAGHGIVAPEYGWNDYEDLDAEGKTVVVLVNDPGFRRGSDDLFRGNAMTYYGRWTYKFEEAERQGAKACLIVHEDDAAGYDWRVVQQSWGRPQLKIASELGDPRTVVQGWMTRAAAVSMFDALGADFEALREASMKPDSKPRVFDASFAAKLQNRVERLASNNVVGKVVGAKMPDEAVLVCAHWDHLGTRAGSDREDNIFNGAVDNASGTAALLELAEAIASQETPPDRSVLFLATTAEEKGLLGSAYYASDPIFPLAKTVCGLNIDVVNTLGPMEDIAVVGFGASELDDDLRAVAHAQGRRVVPEAEPEKGYYFRSDHFSLAKVGVPMLYAGKGTVSVEHGSEWVAEQEKDFRVKRYHSVRDEYDPNWNLEGAAQDVRLYHALVTLWANDPHWREWAEDSEFRAAREASLSDD